MLSKTIYFERKNGGLHVYQVTAYKLFGFIPLYKVTERVK